MVKITNHNVFFFLSFQYIVFHYLHFIITCIISSQTPLFHFFSHYLLIPLSPPLHISLFLHTFTHISLHIVRIYSCTHHHHFHIIFQSLNMQLLQLFSVTIILLILLPYIIYMLYTLFVISFSHVREKLVDNPFCTSQNKNHAIFNTM